jgi:hypothetical protein
MKKNLINDPFRNPFHNRFHVPVHSRLDEMQTNMHTVWPNRPTTSNDGSKKGQHLRGWERGALAGAFALVLVAVVSAVLLSN